MLCMITFTAALTTKELGESVLFQPVLKDLSHVPFTDTLLHTYHWDPWNAIRSISTDN